MLLLLVTRREVIVDAVSHRCSKRLKPPLILPKEKFECSEALLSSSSLNYCLILQSVSAKEYFMLRALSKTNMFSLQ